MDGKEYLDFVSGIAVFALGYGNEEYNQALKDQIDKVIHTSNYYYNAPAIEAAKKMKEISGLDRVFFTNSGAEAIEGAIKAARKYAFLKDGKTDHEIIAMNHSFHGRTMGALSVTGNPHYREAFEPMIGNIRFADFNDLESVKARITDKTCAIIFETVQGEGGIYPVEEEFLKGVRAICDEKDILLILDEIQCGMGRSGKIFAFEYAGIVPDVILASKAIGGTQPMSVVIYNKKLDTWGPGAHAGTFRGNQLAMVAGTVVMERLKSPGFLDDVVRKGDKFRSRMEALKKECPIIGDVRGKGLMLGIEFVDPNGPKDIMGHPVESGTICARVQKECFENHLVMEKGGRNGSVMRCLTALNISDSDLETGIEILEKVVRSINKEYV